MPAGRRKGRGLKSATMNAQYAVIFDVDGVLIDSYRPHLQSWQALGVEIGRPITEPMFHRTFGRTSREALEEFFGRDLTPDRIRQLDERKEELYRLIIREDFPQMPGADPLIDRLLQAQVKIAAGSSGPRLNVELVLELLGRRERFDAVITGDDVTRGKPDPQVFLLAARRLGMAPDRCLVVEDALPGLAAAKAAGMKAIAITGTAGRDELALASDHVIDHLDEITPQIVRRILG